jgi:HEAT repeat protein
MADTVQYSREQLMSFLSNASPAIRRGALLTLIKAPDEEMIPPIERLREDPDPEIRQLAAKVAAFLRDKLEEKEEPVSKVEKAEIKSRLVDENGKFAPARLEQLLEDGDVKNKIAALHIVTEIFEPALVDALIKRLAVETSKLVQARILAALGKNGRTSSMPAILKYVEMEDPVLKFGALDGLENVGDKSVLRHIIPLLKDKDPRIVNRVKKIVSRFDGDSIVSELGFVLNSPEPEMRGTAFAILKGMSGPAVVNMLLESLRDPEDKLQIAAYKELSKIQFYKIVKDFKKFKDKMSEKLKKSTKSKEEYDERKDALFKSTTIEGLSDLLDASSRQGNLMDEKDFQNLIGEDNKLEDEIRKAKRKMELEMEEESAGMRTGRDEEPAEKKDASLPVVEAQAPAREKKKKDWRMRVIVMVLVVAVLGNAFVLYKVLKSVFDSLKGYAQVNSFDLAKEIAAKEREKRVALEGEIEFIQHFILKKQFETAKRQIGESLKRFPTSSKIQDRLAYVYLIEENFEGAREILVQIIDADKIYDDAYYYLGIAYEKLGQPEDAARTFLKLSIIGDTSLANTYAEKWIRGDKKSVVDLYAEERRQIEELRIRLKGGSPTSPGSEETTNPREGASLDSSSVEVSVKDSVEGALLNQGNADSTEVNGAGTSDTVEAGTTEKSDTAETGTVGPSDTAETSNTGKTDTTETSPPPAEGAGEPSQNPNDGK